MPTEYLYQPENIELFKQKALQWASLHNIACYYDSNSYSDQYSSFDALIAIDSLDELSSSSGKSFNDLQKFIDIHKKWALGFFSYDLKNELENLQSGNPDNLNFPDLFFFIPRHLILIRGNDAIFHTETPGEILEQINKEVIKHYASGFTGKIEGRIDKNTYIKKVNKLKQHILKGDIYEANFCQEFFSEDADINPLSTFIELNKVSPTPFANFFKCKDHYIISATPERFLCKRKNKLISQPIKGTAIRKQDEHEDYEVKLKLQSDPKEKAENVMIVDLVRNDLTKSAVPGTVEVEELFGIYSFKQVHQMISTVVCEANPQIKTVDLIANTFPMGSMTGAPKVSAMKLIEEFEESKRGVYSGSVGYIAPNGDFDFNVIIRSILYNKVTKYLSFHTRSAITYESDPLKEYEECLLKAKAIVQTLA